MIITDYNILACGSKIINIMLVLSCMPIYACQHYVIMVISSILFDSIFQQYVDPMLIILQYNYFYIMLTI